jgi:hypothetical protein
VRVKFWFETLAPRSFGQPMGAPLPIRSRCGRAVSKRRVHTLRGQQQERITLRKSGHDVDQGRLFAVVNLVLVASPGMNNTAATWAFTPVPPENAIPAVAQLMVERGSRNAVLDSPCCSGEGSGLAEATTANSDI